MQTNWPVPKVDPHQFSDPFALEVDWECLPSIATNFRDHRLDSSRSSEMRFVPTAGAAQMGWGIMFLGLVFIAMGSWGIIKWKDHSYVMALFFGLGATALGIYLLRTFNTPLIFDKSIGYFWKGRGKPTAALNQICALQLLTQRHRAPRYQGSKISGGSYLSYQLNMVFKDKTRINVVDHGDIKSSRTDAKLLADFLSVPLWDAAKTETECLPPNASQADQWVARMTDKIEPRGS